LSNPQPGKRLIMFEYTIGHFTTTFNQAILNSKHHQKIYPH